MPDLHPFPFTPDVIGAIDAYDDDEPFFSAGLCEAEALAGWDDDFRYLAGFRVIGRCVRCGCTPRRACRDGGHGCAWVDDRENLCSRCEAFPERRRFRRRRLLLPFHCGALVPLTIFPYGGNPWT